MAWDVTLIKPLAGLVLFVIYLLGLTNTLPIQQTDSSVFDSRENDTTTDQITDSTSTVYIKRNCDTSTYDTPSCTQTSICHARCTAKCDDSQKYFPPIMTVKTNTTELELEQITIPPLIFATKDGNGSDTTNTDNYCMVQCKPFQNDEWIEDCEDEACIENCAHLHDGGLTGRSLIPDPPYNLTYDQVNTAPKVIQLSWEFGGKKSRHSVFHVVEASSGQYWYNINMTSSNSLSTHLGVCEKRRYRVASVNQFGYNGYSDEIVRSDLPIPGSIRNIYPLRRPYYNTEKNVFLMHYVMEPPVGWDNGDLSTYKVVNLDKLCKGNPLPPMPIVENAFKDSEGNLVVVISVDKTGFPCEFYTNLSAISACGTVGKPTEFNINLTDCTAIDNYNCSEVDFKWPENVENVTATPQPNSKHVTVMWWPPKDLGTSKSVHHYVVQWGSTYTYLPIVMTKEEGRTSVPDGTLSVVITVKEVETQYGVKVIAVVPEKENETEEIDKMLGMMSSQAVFIIPPVKPVYTLPTLSNSSLVVVLTPSPSSTPLGNKNGSTQEEVIPGEPPNMVPLYILMPIVVVALTVISVLVYVKRKRQLTQKEHARQLYNQNPGYNPSVFKQVDSCMTPNPFYEMPRKSGSSAHPDRWEIDRSYVTLGAVLGRGAFGQVVKGSVKTAGINNLRTASCGSYSSGGEEPRSEEITVAVKMLLPFAGDTYKTEFKKEINLMKNIGFHPNVVSIIGCITDMEPLSLIVEHVPHGDLLHYLRNHRQWLQQEHNSDSGIREESPKLTLQDLMCIARQISVGMEFLSQKGFVHRDLACRNILVGDNKLVKIGDFGLTRYIYDDKIYVTKKGGKLPLKWMAIEAIFDLTFTSASDIWSFGVVLFELITLGGTPYPTIANRDLLRELRGGYRMEQPDNCPDNLYEVMTNCWKEMSSDRPTFTDLRNFLDELIETHSGVEYMTFDLDHSKPYYRIDQRSSTNEADEVFGTIQSVSSVSGESLTTEPSISDLLAATACLRMTTSKQNELPKPKWSPRKKLLNIRGRDGMGASSISMHTPLRILRKSADDLLSMSTCSTDQLLSHNSGSTSDPGYDLHRSWVGETKL